MKNALFPGVFLGCGFWSFLSGSGSAGRVFVFSGWVINDFVFMFGSGVWLSRGFVLFSRLGRTDAEFGSLHDAGRLDVVHECIVAGLFLSHGIRRDATFDVFLNGPPSPPLQLSVNGECLHDVRTDIETWQGILRKVIAGKAHPGVTVCKRSFEAFLREQSESAHVYVLEEGGQDAAQMRLRENAVFVLGDHVGLPKRAEEYALRFGEKISALESDPTLQLLVSQLSITC